MRQWMRGGPWRHCCNSSKHRLTESVFRPFIKKKGESRGIMIVVCMGSRGDQPGFPPERPQGEVRESTHRTRISVLSGRVHKIMNSTDIIQFYSMDGKIGCPVAKKEGSLLLKKNL